MRAPQDLIEEDLLRLCSQGGFESLMLFNDEGIPMAAAGEHLHYHHEAMGALSAILRQGAELIEDFHDDTVVNETAIRTSNKYRIISRPFFVDQSKFMLIAIIPQKASYRQITNKAIKTIQTLMSS